MTAITIILPQETDRLHEPDVHALDRQIFTRLAGYTDWDSGLIGVKTPISYARLAADLSEAIPRKAVGKQQRLNARQVRASVDRLVRLGLFSRLSERHQPGVKVARIFWRGMAKADSSERNTDGMQVAQTLHAIADKITIKNNNISKNTNPQPGAHEASDGIFSKQTNKQTNSRVVSMTANWAPDKIAKALLERAGEQPALVQEEWTVEFIMYWMAERHEEQKTNEQWRRLWVGQMLKYLRNPGLFESVCIWGAEEAHQPPRRQQPQSHRTTMTPNTPPPPLPRRQPPTSLSQRLRIPPPPRDDEKLVAYAKKQGFRAPRIGEEYFEYRCYLQTARIAANDGKTQKVMQQ